MLSFGRTKFFYTGLNMGIFEQANAEWPWDLASVPLIKNQTGKRTAGGSWVGRLFSLSRQRTRYWKLPFLFLFAEPILAPIVLGRKTNLGRLVKCERLRECVHVSLKIQSNRREFH